MNTFSDRTPEELNRLRGYKRSAKSGGRGGRASLNLLGTAARVVNISHLPAAWSWQNMLVAHSTKNVQDQGSCGSCWAVSSATVLRAHAELYQSERTFSAQQILDCTPNPKSCGGAGGCQGATAELAMKYTAAAGSLTEEQHRYQGEDMGCPANLKIDAEDAGEAQQDGQVYLPEVSAHGRGQGGIAFGMTGYEQVAINKVEPLLLALYEKGPAVVSVGASSLWMMYQKGIFAGCYEKEAIINHAVSLVGYGEDTNLGKKYWQIQNSWGSGWGEAGFMRLQRGDHAEENQHCGWDRKPLQGTGCAGGPEKVWVCGRCGILSDSVVPTFSLSSTGLMSSLARN